MREPAAGGAKNSSPDWRPTRADVPDLADWPAWRLLAAYENGDLTPAEALDAVLAAARSRGRALGAFTSVFDEDARAAVARLPGPSAARPGSAGLQGVPLSVKDDLFTAGLRTSGGSRAFAEHVPSGEGPAVARARGAGAVVFAKTNLSELSMLLEPGSPLYGLCRNPWRADRIAGASSCGAAAAIAAGIGPLALATDTGGSIRYPAALCGVFGFAPSGGRVPRYGNFGVNHMLCAIGPMARSTRDASLLLSAISGADPSDPATWPWPQPLKPLTTQRQTRVAHLRVAWAERPDLPSDARVLQRVEQTAQALCRDLGWPFTAAPFAPDADAEGQAAFGVLSDCDRLGLMQAAGHLDDARLAAMSSAVQARLARARAHSGSAYALALETRRLFMARGWPLFRQVDLLMSCTLGHVAPPPARSQAVGSDAMSRLWWSNFAGAPAATLPVGFVDGLPVGLHVAARPGADGRLLSACAELERALAPGWGGFSCAPRA